MKHMKNYYKLLKMMCMNNCCTVIFEYIETIILGSCKRVLLQSYLGWPLQLASTVV